MPGFMLHVNAVMQCFHLAPATTMPSQPRVLVMGQPVATQANLWAVAGCLFTIPATPPKPQPCVKVQWAHFSTRVFVNGLPVALQANPGPGAGVCQSVEQIPQGLPLVNGMQTRVFAM